jgi:hypothetical protein
MKATSNNSTFAIGWLLCSKDILWLMEVQRSTSTFVQRFKADTLCNKYKMK